MPVCMVANMTAIYRVCINALQRRYVKFVNLLFDTMLLLFCGKGHHVTCDLTYIGDDIMTQIACNIQRINMVGTIQSNQTGALMGQYLKNNLMKTKSYKYKMWQHNKKPLVASLMTMVGLIKTLSNYHEPIIIANGMMRKR